MTLFQFGFILGESTDVAVATSNAALFLIKLLLIVAGLLYVSFGFIVTRQVVILKKTLITPVTPIVELLGYIHLIVAIGVCVFFFTL